MAKKQALNLNIPKSTQKAVKKALRSNANLFIAYMDPFTLIKTGALRKSAKATDFTDSSFSVVYGQDYVDYVYHNPNITPRTPNTTQYWDDVFYQSSSFALWQLMFSASIINNLDDGGFVNGRK